MSQTKYQAIFYEGRGDDECLGDIIDTEYFDGKPSDKAIENLANTFRSKYVQLYRDKYDNDQYDSLEEEYDINLPGNLYERFSYIDENGKALDDYFNDFLDEDGCVVYVKEGDRGMFTSVTKNN